MGADYLFYVKSIATYAPAFLGYNNSVLARVMYVSGTGNVNGKYAEISYNILKEFPNQCQ